MLKYLALLLEIIGSIFLASSIAGALIAPASLDMDAVAARSAFGLNFMYVFVCALVAILVIGYVTRRNMTARLLLSLWWILVALFLLVALPQPNQRERLMKDRFVPIVIENSKTDTPSVLNESVEPAQP